MSTMCVMETNRFQYWNKPNPTRRDSGEIDVFEAARYYSGGSETRAYTHSSSQMRSPMMEESKPAVLSRRKSLDMSYTNSSITSLSSYSVNEKCMIQPYQDKKKAKLPSSPGSKLAGFLTSIFTQATSSKKKSKSTSESVMKYETHEICGLGARRSSSIGHVHGNGSDVPKLGFRTPSPMSQASNVELYSKARPILSSPENAAASMKKQRDANILEKKKIERESEWTWVNDALSAQKSSRRSGYDDGEDSDSSSDLFDLPNYALGSVYSNGLPVYETTHLEKKGRSRMMNK